MEYKILYFIMVNKMFPVVIARFNKSCLCFARKVLLENSTRIAECHAKLNAELDFIKTRDGVPLFSETPTVCILSENRSGFFK
jgi:hypothetical protein